MSDACFRPRKRPSPDQKAIPATPPARPPAASARTSAGPKVQSRMKLPSSYPVALPVVVEAQARISARARREAPRRPPDNTSTGGRPRPPAREACPGRPRSPRRWPCHHLSAHRAPALDASSCDRSRRASLVRSAPGDRQGGHVQPARACRSTRLSRGRSGCGRAPPPAVGPALDGHRCGAPRPRPTPCRANQGHRASGRALVRVLLSIAASVHQSPSWPVRIERRVWFARLSTSNLPNCASMRS